MNQFSQLSVIPGRSGGSDTVAGLPICVDLDGTLLKTDTLFECLMCLLSRKPFAILWVPFWTFFGKARLKSELERAVKLDTTLLPKNDALIRYLTDQWQTGRKIFLYSAANQSIVDRVAKQFEFFAGCRGSSHCVNLKGVNKLHAIRGDLGGNFIYAGDSKVDLPIWREARGAILTGKAAQFTKRLPNNVPIEASFPNVSRHWRDWFQAIRVHQSIKNALLFAPLLFSGKLPSIEILSLLLLGFIAFSFSASATYIINDLLDLESDRDHPTKRNRPFAAGRLSILQGLIASLVLLVISFVVTTALMPSMFAFAITAYLVLTIAYSARLKRSGPIDVVILSCLFTIRILAGMAFLDEPISLWFLTFSLFFFLGLAFIKRHAELSLAASRGRAGLAHRGYRVADLPIVASSGAACSLSSLLIFVIYLVNEKFPQDVYKDPIWLWCITPILLTWTLRVWFKTIRGEMHDDPIVFALKDRPSWILGLVSLCFIVMAW